MSTKNVKRGANRAYAYGKKTKAAQGSSMLPPRSPEAEAARQITIAEARVLAAKNAAQRAEAQADLECDRPLITAYEWKRTGEEHGWAATLTTGWLDGLRTATVVFTSDGERLVVSWRDGEPHRYPLLTERDGHNVRLATHADALHHLTH